MTRDEWMAQGTRRGWSRKLTAEARFRQSLKAVGDCIEYTVDIDTRADKVHYGRVKVGGRRIGAHRYAWSLVNGPIPKGLQINHTCDNGRCVRIEHLWLGTQSENIKDAYRKGRITASFVKRVPAGRS